MGRAGLPGLVLAIFGCRDRPATGMIHRRIRPLPDLPKLDGRQSMTDFSYAPAYPVHRVPAMARNPVAASQQLASQGGLRMLLKGGNAVGAALATALTLTVEEPTRSEEQTTELQPLMRN